MPLIVWTLFLFGRNGSSIKATQESKEVVQGWRMRKQGDARHHFFVEG
jgi:hypothetical protein